MIEKAGTAPPAESDSEDSGAETTSIPLSLLGGQSVEPGDVVRLEVVSVDEDSGTVDVKYAHSGKKPDMMGMMAGKFDEQSTGET